MDANQLSPDQVSHLVASFIPLIGFFVLVGWAIVIVPLWQIFKKAGFPPALSLLCVLPLVNLFMLYYLAFSRWRVVPVDAYVAYPPAAYPPPPSYPGPHAAPYAQAQTPGYPPPGYPAPAHAQPSGVTGRYQPPADVPPTIDGQVPPEV